MPDPLLSLAVAIHSGKGIYALLLGSGVSRSSGLPTGWEITQDLIRRLCHLQGDSTSEPETWFQKRYGRQPDYSEILGELAHSSAERTKVLQAYFEPSENEPREGLKAPTPAHRAISELVAKGYVRVVVTTNFDRLLEQALADSGVQPIVITSPDGAIGALPLVHARCTVIKLHGDYLDSRFKNTRDELGGYEEPVDSLLDRVFDEYGLIVCGWSAEWDTALCAAINRCKSRRFTTYWAIKGKVSDAAARLINQRRAIRFSIDNADSFFSGLKENVAALESFSATDPLSAQVAVARAKRLWSDRRHTIALSDLSTGETNRLIERTSNAYFPTADENPSTSAVLGRLKRYDAEIDVLLQMVACMAYWAKDEQEEPVFRSFRRIAEEPGPEPGMPVWLKMKRYPALRLLYGIGIPALANRKYDLLERLTSLTINHESGQNSRTAAVRLFIPQ
jgi:SIR2-like domain